MQMKVTVKPVENKGNMKAYADVTFNDMITVKGFVLTQYQKDGKMKYNINMPARKLKESEVNQKSGEVVEYKDLCKPTSAEFRKELLDAIVDTYNQDKTASKTFGENKEFMKVNLHLIKGNTADEKARAMGSLEFNSGKKDDKVTHFVVDRLVIRENKNGKPFVTVPQQSYTDRNGEKKYADRFELSDDAKGIIIGQFNKMWEKSLDNVLGNAKVKSDNLQKSDNAKSIEQSM